MHCSQNRGWLFRLTFPVTQYLITNLSVTIGYIFFHFLNRTTVIGKKNVPQKPNTLLLSNHQTMIDSFLVGMCGFYPNSLFRPGLIPSNPAAEENFYRTPFLAWVADNWKCIPIKKGRKDVSAIYRMAQALRKSPLTLFPEGTRSRDGSMGKPRAGAGLLILETKPTVIPVCIDGMDKLLPIGSIFPRIFKRIYIYYGEPLDLSEFCGREKKKDVAQSIMNQVMETIREMHTEIQTMKAPKAAPSPTFFRKAKKNLRGLLKPLL
ncbi:1-acyl-sn-glycerol-3-phosphate acyltransferase [candidate division KSB1 bacterium]|nr:1-acyl-sn-glycerol-3-phosphate acyltransferase [candidate division KSB1 bacterium]